MKMVWCVLRVKRFCSFDVWVDRRNHAGEGGENGLFGGFQFLWSSEGDVFRRDDALGECQFRWETVDWEASCDFGGNWESWDSEGG